MPCFALHGIAHSPGNRQHVLQLLLRLRHVRVAEVNLVDDGNDVEVQLRREVIIRHGLRLDALRGVNHQQRAFARAQAARDFVGKIHMAGRVNQVQLVGLAVARLVKHRDRMRLDGDAAFALQIHRVEQLVRHVARGDGAGMCSSRSESVVLPWSMWAMMLKFLMCAASIVSLNQSAPA